ncbi:MAG: 2-oxoglutarate dehydrogenase complex dihydrolipoyllysine-residue succinyltransferase [Pseudomonadales bacterium]|nr:2-oxoglutarate dehydrogenase complex dihydrolipoyllysine-residue succinyltransferase [Pseudomonadales bacterium]
MMTEIKAPEFPESIADGEIAAWHVQVGESVRRDQVLVDIETDKVVLEVVAPADGKLTEILKQEGDTVLAEEVLAHFTAGDVSDDTPAPAPASEDSGTQAKAEEKPAEMAVEKADAETANDNAEAVVSPAARKIADENKIDVTRIEGTGKGGRVTKEDVLKAVAALEQQPAPVTPRAVPVAANEPAAGDRIERRVPMTRLRASVARRLVEAQQTAAMLTTFNEVDMTAIMELRKLYKDAFEKAHGGTRLGFMSFFVRASVEALKRFPAVNASIDGSDIVYHGYQDVGVAISSPRGLVVPVLRDADSLTLAEIEDQIREYGQKAQENKLAIDDMTGGTFTVSNGGTFGSLLSTPILNPPQTGILGMHKIQDRPMAVNGEVKIRPMMYLALSYDHRLIDGQEAVRFLVTIKELLEEPAKILLDI